MRINLPEIHAEVQAVCARYEAALMANDVAVLDSLFWQSPHTLRFGDTGNQYGFEAIRAFRAALPLQSPPRTVLHQVVTTYGRDFATSNLEFRRDGGSAEGRQSQTWVRAPEGWRVVAAHVSLL